MVMKSAAGHDLMLGKTTPIPILPMDARLDAVAAPEDNIEKEFVTPGLVYAPARYLVRLSCPEFTSLCPATGQPDFAHIVIDYVPHRHLVESKSLKLFLASFRNHQAFHEQCSAYIGRRITQTATPIWLRVSAFWFARGGIPIDVFWEVGDIPANLHVPNIDIPTYRAR